MRKFKFKGYQDRYVYYGEGKFTVGKAYAAETIGYYPSYPGSGTPDALFIDDEGVALWEELHHFEEVFDNAK